MVCMSTNGDGLIEVREGLRIAVPEYLGREHFLAYDELATPQVTRKAFGVLTARKAFPNDRRQPDVEALGLVIVSREQAGLGEIPPFARFQATESISTSHEPGRYALNTVSLAKFVMGMNTEKIERPKKLAQETHTATFLTALVLEINKTAHWFQAHLESK